MQNHTFTFNPENWVDDELTINATCFAGAWEWEQNGEVMSLRNRKVYDDFVCYDVYCGDRPLDIKVGKTFEGKFKEDHYTATDDLGEMTRTDKYAVVAAAKMIAMVM